MSDRFDTITGSIRMWLVVVTEGRPQRAVEVGDDRFVIGRGEGCDLVLDDAKVSREHAAIMPGLPGRRLLLDLDSANGTLVNGRPMSRGIGFAAGPEKVAELWGEERLQFGDTLVVATTQDPRSILARTSSAPSEPGAAPADEPTGPGTHA